MDKATREIQIRDTLRIEQNQWLPLWRDCTAFCCPQKQRTVENAYAQLDYTYRPRFNPMRQSSTAIDSLNVLSGGLKSWLTPGGDEGWGGQWQPPDGSGDAFKDWLADCTNRSIPLLQSGGFFTADHEMYQDLGVFGTAGMFIGEGDEHNPIVCEAMTPVNFLIQRDWMGNVIRYQVTWSKAATWIKNKFNQPGDGPLPPQVEADASSPTAMNQVHELLESVYLRGPDEIPAENTAGEPAGQAYGSCWIHVASKMILRERGYQEMPFVAPRWNTWAGTNSSAYGTSPAMQALADCKGLNLMDMIQATRAEIEINPRLQVGPAMSGTIDLSPQGISQVPDMNSVVELAKPGSYQIGMEFNQALEGRIKRAFFTPLFEAISPIINQRELNNYVAEQVRQEAAALISPAMSRLDKDFFQQAMLRVFMVLYRAPDVFAPAPEEAFKYDKAGQRFLYLPRVLQANRMARTLNARKSFAFSQTIGRLQIQVAMGHPEVMDHYNFEAINADLDRGDGMPNDWKFTPEEVQKMRADKAAIAQQQAVQQTASDAIVKDPVGVAGLAGIGPGKAA